MAVTGHFSVKTIYTALLQISLASFIALNGQLNVGAATSSNLATMALAQTPRVTILQAQSLDEMITSKAKENGVDPVLAKKIASCESESRQFDKDGEPLRGEKNPEDVGLFRINEKFHLEASETRGDDIYTTEGNIDYAMWLLKNEGSQHWKASQACWNKAQA